MRDCVMRKTILAISLIGLVVGVPDAFAKSRVMECREWFDKEYMGKYRFFIDSESDTAKVEWITADEDYKRTHETAAIWHKIWQDDTGRRVLIYAVNESETNWFAPVKVFSLDFGGVHFYTYALGGAAEESEVVTVITNECERLD